MLQLIVDQVVIFTTSLHTVLWAQYRQPCAPYKDPPRKISLSARRVLLCFSLGEARDSKSLRERLAVLPVALSALMGCETVNRPASVKGERKLTANGEAAATAASDSASRVANGDAQLVAPAVGAGSGLEGRLVAGLDGGAALGEGDASVPGALDDGVGDVDDALKVGEGGLLGRGGGEGEGEEREEVGSLHFAGVGVGV